MSNESDKKIVKQDEKDKTKTTVQKKSSAKTVPVLIAGLLIVVAAATYLVKKEFQNFTEHKHAELNGLTSQLALLQKNITGLQEQQKDLLGSINVLVEDQLGLEKNITALYQGQNNSNQEWALAEIEYLLLIATHRLLLGSDINTALAAIQAADNRLRDLPDPGLLAVRKQLTADINTLRAVELVDISGLALYLADLTERADTLPLRDPKIKIEQGPPTTVTPEEQSISWWEKLLSSVWQELKDVIIISHDDEQVKLSLTPQQTFFLRQNLRLQLESARYAVLRYDTEDLHNSVEIVNNWLTDYFSSSDKSVSNIIESLSQMKSLELNPELPDISSSLETVRAYIKASSESDKQSNNDNEGVVQ